MRWERLTPTQLDDLEFLELVYAPGAESNSALYVNETDETMRAVTVIVPHDSTAFSHTGESR